ncbi:hypothetical protein [Brucella sp. 10RB9213]|uniref:hypothetical protein n=1 Tax=Brucella sp. 10RB9213 TaxID=1844039 RepID=UPI0012ADD4C8|nr:hypothetical protein [Brucella sp. 10RB9213]MRN66389.1 hypothetical protein [Brucella sp. 10RB9213]
MTEQKPPLVRVKRAALMDIFHLIRRSYRTSLLKACARNALDMEEAAIIEDDALMTIEAEIKNLPKE